MQSIIPLSKLPQVGTTIFTLMSQLAAKHQAINLSQGFPDFDGPQLLRNLVCEHIQNGHNQYCPLTGVPKLREQIKRKVAGSYGIELDADQEITVIPGATEAIYCAIMATIRQGDEVIVFDPAYDCYDPSIQLAGGNPIHIPLQAPEFSIDWQRVKDSINSRTRMIIINSPNNPTGAVISPEDLDTLAELVRDTKILILSDEVYEHLIYDGAVHASVLGHPELYQRAFIVFSFGKTYHVTGWKTGYCIAPAGLTAEFRKVHQFVTFVGVTPIQMALADYLEQDSQHHLQLPAFYQQKRDYFCQLLKGSRFEFTPTPGTYFQLVDYRNISDQDDLSMAEWMTKTQGVAAIPISVFYQNPPKQTYLRLCFAKESATLEKGAEILCKI
jgi:methionine aminotransferase